MRRHSMRTAESLPPALPPLLQMCREARSINELLETIQRPLFDTLNVEAISLAIVGEPTIYVTSIKPLSTTFKAQIMGHKTRCLPSLSSDQNTNQSSQTIQQLGVVINPKPMGDFVRIAWTGALESQGHLLAVVTFYSDEARTLSDKQVNLLRQIRACMADVLLRVGQTGNDALDEHKTEESSAGLVLIKLVDDSRVIDPADRMTQEWVRAVLVRMLTEQIGPQVQTWTMGPNMIAVLTDDLSGGQRPLWIERLATLESLINQRLGLEFRFKANFADPIDHVQTIESPGILIPKPPKTSVVERDAKAI